MAERPNFLFIITDQQRADHLGCYGNGVLKTPNIDAIAARGTRFDRFYVASPVCMPNRATWLTGRMPSLHKVRSNGIPLNFSNVTFPELLHARGWRTALIGKSHIQNMTDRAPVLISSDQRERACAAELRDAMRCRIDTEDYSQERRSRWRDPAHRIATPYYGFAEVELCNDHGDGTFGDYERWARHREPRFLELRGRAHATADTRYTAPQAWRTRVPEDLYSTHFVAERASAWLERHAREHADEPFFLALSFPDPHHPFTPPGRYWDYYDPADIAAPHTCRQPDESAPPHVRWLHAERAAGRAVLDSSLPFAVSPREARETIALTYGMIAMIDERIGRVLSALERTGLADHTVVAFTSDHGDFMGDHGLMLKAPIHYDGLIRVPFIWSDPQQYNVATSTELAGTVDIAATVLNRAGVPPVNGMQGRNLFPSRPRELPAAPDCMLIEDETQSAYCGFKHPVRARTLVTQHWRLTIYRETEWGEMYELTKDPAEERNLWNTQVNRRAQRDLLEMLARSMLSACDQSPLPTARA